MKRPKPSNNLVAGLLFLALVLVYHMNHTVIDEGDAVPNINLPISLLQRGTLAFSPDYFPEMFKWKTTRPLPELDDFYFIGWDEIWWGRSLRAWRSAGHIKLNGPRYYIVQSPRQKVHVSTFGPVSGLLVLPITACVYAIDTQLAAKLPLKTSLAKLEGSLLVAACAALLFLIAARRTTRFRALLLASVYGVGTCAWAISSQNLWQQTVNQFLLTLGAFLLLGNVDRPLIAALCGFAFGAATANRPTGVFVLVPALVYLLVHHRKSALPFVLGSLPIPLAVAVYNQHFFASPFTFAQELVGHTLATQKTGSPRLWQTPLWEGALGLLASPSRGLLVFSPLLGLAAWGGMQIWRDADYRAYRPLTVGAVAMMALQCMWFDWWGGWAYGYRPWLEVVPYLTLFLLPIIDAATSTKRRLALFVGALGWSVFVQGLGALSYDRSWNARRMYVVRVPSRMKPLIFTEEQRAKSFAKSNDGRYIGPTFCDIDLHYCRLRLWSVTDNVIWYHLTHFSETRGRRMKPGWDLLGR